MEGVFIIFPIISVICVIMNICVLVLLFKTKNLKNRRFNCLVLYLSISDTAIGLLSIGTGLSQLPFIGEETSHYICTFVGTLIRATIIFSMYQVFLICVERLNATYSVSNVRLKRMTSDWSVGIGCITIHLYAVLVWVYNIQTTKPICEISLTLSSIVTLDIPAMALTTTTVILYIIIIARTIRQHKRIRSQTDLSSHNLNSFKNVKMRRSMITLGIIISISTLIVVPRPIASVALIIVGYEKSHATILMTCTYLMILNPVIDPVIYVLRIQEFRRRLLCCHVRSVTATATFQNPAECSSNTSSQISKGRFYFSGTNRTELKLSSVTEEKKNLQGDETDCF